VTGTATAVKVTTLGLLGGVTTVLGNTGSLSGVGDARGAGSTAGNVGSILTGETPHATTMAWPDQVASQASIGSLGMLVAGIPISADVVTSSVTSLLGGGTDTTSLIQNLVLNEQTVGSNGATTVNALHAVVFGVVDVVVASATAGIR
jgi:hypothetical protein